MAYVTVTIVHPNGDEYQADVDTSASYDQLLSTLTQQLGLPENAEDGTRIEYEFGVYGATGLEPGATIRVREKERPLVIRGLTKK